MKCPSCTKTNLPGGIRCVYCGSRFPAHLDFDLNFPRDNNGLSQSDRAQENLESPKSEPVKTRRGLLGVIAFLLLKAKSLFALLKFGKIALTLSTMLLSISVYSRLFGWKFAAGFVICIFVHEMGHVAVNKLNGLPASAPMFIPFVGAMIFVKKFPDEPRIQSECGAGGPAGGLLAAIVCLILGYVTKSPFWFALTSVGAIINMFNMAPFPPLDGSHIGTVFSPKIWFCTLMILLLFNLKIGFAGPVAQSSAMLMAILLIAFLLRVVSPPDQRYLLASPSVRIRMAAIYVGLCLLLATTSGLAKIGLKSVATTRNSTALGIRSFSSVEDEKNDQADARASETDDNIVGPDSAAEIPILLVGIALAGWTATFFLVRSNAGTSKFLSQGLGTVALVGIASGIALASAKASHPILLGVLGASLVSSVITSVYSSYMLINRKSLPRYPSTILTAKVFGLGAIGWAVMAYATNSWLSVVILFATAALVVLFNPWLIVLSLANIYLALGKTGAAIKYLEELKSADCPHDIPAYALSQLLPLQLRNSNGQQALMVLEELQETGKPLSRINLHAHRCSALTLLGRFDEATLAVELLVQIVDDDPLVHARLMIAHSRLAEIMRLRAWGDECVSQADKAILRAAPTARELQASLHLMRGAGLCIQGDIVGARQAVLKAQERCREPSMKSRTAAVECAILLAEEKPNEAARLAGTTLTEVGDDLELQFCLGKALGEAGNKQAAITSLTKLELLHPADYWGRRATEQLSLLV